MGPGIFGEIMKIQGIIDRTFNINNKIINVKSGMEITVNEHEAKRIVLNGAGVIIKPKKRSTKKAK